MERQPPPVEVLPPHCRKKFRVDRLLTEGGYGRIFLATQIDLERPVVVKVLSSRSLSEVDDVKRFLAEAQITTRLAHPNIVIVLDHEVEDGVPWIAYEYLAGRTLRDVLATGPLPLESALEAGSQIAAALDAAHAHGILHRDIKPENVIEIEPGRYKVIDFGIAKWMGSSSVQTAAGMVIGTPVYMAPELILGQPPTPQNDIYALGILLFEMLTGCPPFWHESPIEIMSRHINEPAPRPGAYRPDLPPELDGVVARTLAKDPTQRYRTAGELCKVLDVRRMDISLRRLPNPPRITRRQTTLRAMSRDSEPAITSIKKVAQAVDTPVSADVFTTGARRRPRPGGGALLLGGAVALVASAVLVSWQHHASQQREASPAPAESPSGKVDGRFRVSPSVPVAPAPPMLELDRKLQRMNLSDPKAHRQAVALAVDFLRRTRTVRGTGRALEPADRVVSWTVGRLALQNVFESGLRLAQTYGPGPLEESTGVYFDAAGARPDHALLVVDLVEVAPLFLGPRNDALEQFRLVTAVSYLTRRAYWEFDSYEVLKRAIVRWRRIDPEGWVGEQIEADRLRELCLYKEEMVARQRALRSFEAQYVPSRAKMSPSRSLLVVWRTLAQTLFPCHRETGDILGGWRAFDEFRKKLEGRGVEREAVEELMADLKTIATRELSQDAPPRPDRSLPVVRPSPSVAPQPATDRTGEPPDARASPPMPSPVMATPLATR